MPDYPSARQAAVAGPMFMVLSAAFFTAMNLLLKQAVTDFSIWDIGFYRFGGGLVVLAALFSRRGNPFRSGPTSGCSSPGGDRFDRLPLLHRSPSGCCRCRPR